ncbi:MAG: hypothetical protein J6X02_05835 [Bacilli bacterium]|nr:hypothetical protein [Bacilli bacterium]
MKEIAIEVLNIIYNFGYEAYIVGGFVRDMLLDIESNDVDITTNATPMELKNIFPDIDIDKNNYGSVTLYYKNNRFEITTYRKDLEYIDNRHPSKITYVNDLKTDLLRRDFTINTICIDKDGNIVDLLDGRIDLGKKIVRSILDADKSFSDDSLRILRAIRFATLLKCSLSQDVVEAINKHKELLKNISYNRKKRELDKIFGSSEAKNGIELLKSFELDKELELDFTRVKDYSDLVGIWAMINNPNYAFTSSEKELIKNVNEVYELNNLDHHVLYQYGLYVNILAGINKGLSKQDITIEYDMLPIKEKDDINITAEEICKTLKVEPSAIIGKIYKDITDKILDNKLENDKDVLIKYIKDVYKK